MENVLFAILYLHVYQLLKHICIIVSHTQTPTELLFAGPLALIFWYKLLTENVFILDIFYLWFWSLPTITILVF